MIGSDEFNFYRTPSDRDSASNADETEYLETFLNSGKKSEHKTQLLIDIVCPQPRSRVQRSTASSNKPPITRTMRTNSTNGWRK